MGTIWEKFQDMHVNVCHKWKCNSCRNIQNKMTQNCYSLWSMVIKSIQKFHIMIMRLKMKTLPTWHLHERTWLRTRYLLSSQLCTSCVFYCVTLAMKKCVLKGYEDAIPIYKQYLLNSQIMLEGTVWDFWLVIEKKAVPAKTSMVIKDIQTHYLQYRKVKLTTLKHPLKLALFSSAVILYTAELPPSLVYLPLMGLNWAYVHDWPQMSQLEEHHKEHNQLQETQFEY